MKSLNNKKDGDLKTGRRSNFFSAYYPRRAGVFTQPRDLLGSIGTKQNMKLYTKTEGDIKSLFKNIQNKVIGVLINDEYKCQQHRQIHAKEV